MGIRFYCPNGHKLNVKTFQAGRRGICPYCGVSVQIPLESTRPSSKKGRKNEDLIGPAAPEGRAQAFDDVAGPGRDDLGGAHMTPPVEPAPIEPARPEGGQAFTVPVGQPAFTSPIEPQATTPDPVPLEPVLNSQIGQGLSSPSQEPAAPEVPSPLKESPEATWYVRPPSGGQFGPATADLMTVWLEEGRVGSDSLVWRDGWPDWQEAGKVFPELGAGREPSPDHLIAREGTGIGSGRPPRPGHRRDTTNAIIIAVLLVAVVVLLGVFLYVLFNPPRNSVSSRDSSEAVPRAATIDAGAANVRQFGRECPWVRALVGRPTIIGNAGLNRSTEESLAYAD